MDGAAATVNRGTISTRCYSQSPIVRHIFQLRFRPPRRVAFEGLLGMAEIWRELGLSVGCRSSQTLEPSVITRNHYWRSSNIPEREDLHQKVVTFGIVIRLCDAPIHFLSSLGTRKSKPTVTVNDDEIALSNET